MKQLLQQVGSIWSEGTPTQRFLGGLSLLVVAVGLWAAVYLSTRPDYALLFGNLEPADAAQVVDVVEGTGVRVDVRAGGRSVFVPREQVAEMRMRVSSAGLPRGSGTGWELFDKSSFGVSDFEHSVMYRRALEGELSRSISTFEAVDSARVSITKPKRSPFVSSNRVAKASVVVRTMHSRELSRDNVAAIRHLIAGAVEGLEPNRVSVLDTRGKVLSEPESDSLTAGAGNQVELQQQVESYLVEKAQAMLDQVGVRAVVQVALDLDFQQMRKTSEIYEPEGRVLSETIQSNSSKPASIASEGPVGAESKIDGGLALASGATPPSESNEETIKTEYTIGRTVKSEENTAPNVRRMTVSMFLHQDHDASLAKIENLVKTAVGFDPARGDQMESMTIDFGEVAVEEPVAEDPGAPGWMWMVERGIQVLGVLGALFILFRALRSTDRAAVARRRGAAPARQGDPALAGVDLGQPGATFDPSTLTEEQRVAAGIPVGVGAEGADGAPGTLRDVIRTSVESDPTAATRVLRNWLREGNPN